MAPHGKGGGKRGKGKIGKRRDDAEMIKLLAERIAAEAPPPGTNPLADKMSSDALAKRFDQVHSRGSSLSRSCTAHMSTLDHSVLSKFVLPSHTRLQQHEAQIFEPHHQKY